MPNNCVAIIGAGRVGMALGGQWARAGYRVIYGTRNPSAPTIIEALAQSGGVESAVSLADAAAQAEVILLAVPWSAAEVTLKALGPIAGKIIIDATNLFEFRDGQHLEVNVLTSGGELVQEWAPQARVVKGFNTTNWRVMADPKIAEGPVSIPLAGDYPDATAKVAEMVRAIGFEAFDTGPLAQARHLEHLAFLYINVLIEQRVDMFEFYLSRRQR